MTNKKSHGIFITKRCEEVRAERQTNPERKTVSGPKALKKPKREGTKERVGECWVGGDGEPGTVEGKRKK